jgi:hypothetical protein
VPFGVKGKLASLVRAREPSGSASRSWRFGSIWTDAIAERIAFDAR